MTTKADAERYQEHQALKRTNPHAAALYVLEHGDAIARGREATPAPKATTEQRLVGQIAERSATKLSVQRKAQADAAALLAFNDYQALKATNPHAAALRLNEDADAIFRGRELAAAATPDPEPPQAA